MSVVVVVVDVVVNVGVCGRRRLFSARRTTTSDYDHDHDHVHDHVSCSARSGFRAGIRHPRGCERSRRIDEGAPHQLRQMCPIGGAW
jgi:hypothetical protein